MQDLQGDDDSGGREEKKRGEMRKRGGTQQPNGSRRTERVEQPESALAVLFCNCVPLTAAPAINTMGRGERALLVRDHLLTEIIFSLALG